MIQRIHGSVHSALTHFAMLGLAGIVEQATRERSLVWWSDDPQPRAFVGFDGSADVGELVRAHAERQSRASWMTAKTASGAIFSPRVKIPSSRAEWVDRQRMRHTVLDALVGETACDELLFLGALGEAAYWRFDRDDPRPDEGASRLEMKARNKGMEFISDGLSGLARAVADKEPKLVEDELVGEAPPSSDQNEKSRTSLGLTPPGPQRHSIAWCGLWGLASFPVSPHVGSISSTASVEPGRLHPRWLVLPVFSRPTSLHRVRAVLSSREWNEHARYQGNAAFESATEKHDDFRAELARERLLAWGVVAAVTHRIKKAGSTSAPERQVLDGTVFPVGGAPHDYR